MKCQKCSSQSKLKATHSYQAGIAGKTQRWVCPTCNTVYTAVTLIVQQDPVRGQGARKLADVVARGGMRISLSPILDQAATTELS